MFILHLRFSKENFPKILQLADGLAEIGSKHNATAGQTTLAWILAQGQDIIPIPGTRVIKVCHFRKNDLACSLISSTQYLKENNASVNVKLDKEEVGKIRSLAEGIQADIGEAERYPPHSMHLLFADTAPL